MPLLVKGVYSHNLEEYPYERMKSKQPINYSIIFYRKIIFELVIQNE